MELLCLTVSVNFLLEHSVAQYPWRFVQNSRLEHTFKHKRVAGRFREGTTIGNKVLIAPVTRFHANPACINGVEGRYLFLERLFEDILFGNGETFDEREDGWKGGDAKRLNIRVRRVFVGDVQGLFVLLYIYFATAHIFTSLTVTSSALTKCNWSLKRSVSGTEKGV